jgi:hypothetical protein
MKASKNKRPKIGSHQNVVCCSSSFEDSTPPSFSARYLQVLVSGHECGDDEKADKTSVHESRKAMIARRAGGRPFVSGTKEVVNSVDGKNDVNGGLDISLVLSLTGFGVWIPLTGILITRL